MANDKFNWKFTARELVLIGTFLFGIAVAWSTSQADIDNLKEKYKTVSEQLREFRKEHKEDMRYIRRYLDNRRVKK